MEFDIRTNQAGEITLLRFADASGGDYHVASGILHGVGVGVSVIDIESERDLWVCSEEHAQNLIKAINKAIELGWFKE